VNEVRLRNGRIVRKGIKTTLSDMRLSQSYRLARARWDAKVNAPTLLVVSKERRELGHFWRHAYATPWSGPYVGNVVNPDTGRPVIVGDDQIRRPDSKKVKLAEMAIADGARSGALSDGFPRTADPRGGVRIIVYY
jgi:hypothetical protein